MEYIDSPAFAHARYRENIEDSILELSGRLANRSETEEQATWSQVAELKKLDALLEQALEFFKDVNR